MYQDDLNFPPRNFGAARWILVSMMTLASVALQACVAVYAYDDYRSRVSAAEQDLDHIVEVCQQSALKILSANTALANRVGDLLGNTDAAVRPDEPLVHARLADSIADSPQVASIAVFGKDGKLLVDSQFSPPPQMSIARRTDFLSARAAAPPPYFVETVDGNAPTNDVLVTTVARRSGGEFRGVIAVAAPSKYFADFYRQVVGGMRGYAIGLYWQGDAFNVAGYGSTGNERHVMPEIAVRHAQSAGLEDGDQFNLLFRSRRLNTYPLYVAVAFDMSVLKQEWLGAIKFEVQHLARVRCAHAKKKNVSTASA